MSDYRDIPLTPALGGGYELVTLYPNRASEALSHVMPRGGGLALANLESAYAERVEHERRTGWDSPTEQIWLPEEVRDGHRGVMAAFIDMWRYAGDKSDPLIVKGRGELYRAVCRQAPGLIFQPIATRLRCKSGHAGEGYNADAWLSVAEVLLCVAARWEHEHSDRNFPGQAALARDFEALNPGWRAEYARRWSQDSPRAVLVALQRAPWVADELWAPMLQAVLDPVDSMGPANTAQFLYGAVWRGWPLRSCYTEHAHLMDKLALGELAAHCRDVEVIDGVSSFQSDGAAADGRNLEARVEGFMGGRSVHSATADYWRHQLLAAQLPQPTRAAAPGPSL